MFSRAQMREGRVADPAGSLNLDQWAAERYACPITAPGKDAHDLLLIPTSYFPAGN